MIKIGFIEFKGFGNELDLNFFVYKNSNVPNSRKLSFFNLVVKTVTKPPTITTTIFKLVAGLIAAAPGCNLMPFKVVKWS